MRKSKFWNILSCLVLLTAAAGCSDSDTIVEGDPDGGGFGTPEEASGELTNAIETVALPFFSAVEILLQEAAIPPLASGLGVPNCDAIVNCDASGSYQVCADGIDFNSCVVDELALSGGVDFDRSQPTDALFHLVIDDSTSIDGDARLGDGTCSVSLSFDALVATLSGDGGSLTMSGNLEDCDLDTLVGDLAFLLDTFSVDVVLDGSTTASATITDLESQDILATCVIILAPDVEVECSLS
jgi:hypothetical protein